MAVDTEDDDQISGETGEQEDITSQGDDEQQGGEESTESEGETKEGEKSGEQEEAGELVITIGDEESPSSEDENQTAPQWVKDLRKEHRETQRQKRELEQQLAELRGAQQQPGQRLEKPTLEGCDFDEAEYERRFVAYTEQQAQVRAQQQEREQQERAQQEAWAARLDQHKAAKAALKVLDYDDAEDVLKTLFNQTQQGILLHGAENSALLAYAIGKNPAKAKELASITDPVKFAFAVAKLETKVKATPRKVPPPPEKTLRGSAPSSASVESQLARLEAEADKSGDRSKVIAFKRQQMQRQAG